jgi:hypothetical protein
MVEGALSKMHILNTEVVDLFEKHGLSFVDNLGRRNGVLSHAQEKFFAEELGKVFKDVCVDGKTGQPDIVIHDIDKELECKLTSGNGKYSNFSLQTDYNTLSKKGRLDHLYVLANGSFDNFVVLHFEGLTIKDFFVPAPGAKGKSRMRKHVAMEKCHVLWGEAKIKNKIEINKIEQQIKSVKKEMSESLSKIFAQRGEHNALYKKEKARYNKKLKKLNKRKSYWVQLDNAYRFILKPLSDERKNT